MGILPRRLPISVPLLGEVIRVEKSPSIVTEQDALGLAVYDENKIIIQEHADGCPRTNEQMWQTLLHELTHLILHRMGQNKLRDNEKFVDMYAGLLHQALTGMKFARQKKKAPPLPEGKDEANP